jgi:hypothetical protein
VPVQPISKSRLLDLPNIYASRQCAGSPADQLAAEMEMKMKILSNFLIVLSFFAFNATAKDKQKYILNGEEYTPVPYCELAQHPKQYDGKRVIVRANFNIGFEQNFTIFGVKCTSEGITLLGFYSDDEATFFRKAAKHFGFFNATLYGTFRYSKSVICPSCSFRFELRKIENVDNITRSTRWDDLDTLSEKAKRKVCQGDEMPKFLHSR